MKGKRFSFIMVLSLLLVGVTSFCFALKPESEQMSVVAAKHDIATLNREDYSALFGGDVIFSAEKVLVSNLDADNDGYPDVISGAKSFLAAEENEYSFLDVYDEQNSKSKTVVKDGDFVKLDNYQSANGKYYDPVSINADKQQAILVSFGAYVYYPAIEEGAAIIPENVLLNSEIYDDNETPENTEDDILACAGITYLQVGMKHNGVSLSTPTIREISIGQSLYFDFAMLIVQSDRNEGYYELSFRYMIKGKEYSGNFSFYIINNLSYTREIGDSTKGYSARPMLGWTDSSLSFERTEVVNEYVQFYIGNTGLGLSEVYRNLSFPTITYDYTRYKLSYTYSAYKKTTIYDYQVVFNTQKTEAKLVCSVTSSAGVETREYEMLDYSKDNGNNLVSIVLTEPGNYVADYEFLYDGYAAANAPTPNFETNTIKLEINGFSAYYSKAGVDSAKLQYFEIARNRANQVDVVLPDAFEINSTEMYDEDETLGFAYKFVDFDKKIADGTTNPEYDAYREGNVIFDSKYASVSAEIFSGTALYNQLVLNENVQITEDALPMIEYVETNQGALSVESSDVYIGGESFYYYSPSKLTYDMLEDCKFNIDNTTTFNKKGYYLVFVKVNSNTIDDGEVTKSYLDYYQIFAFRYTSISVNMFTDDNGALSKSSYTNKAVTIAWKTPGLFDSKIKPYYYAAENQNLTYDEMVQTVKMDLPTSAKLGEDGVEYTTATLGENVAAGSFVRYVVRLENEGKRVTEKMFTVDRQPISGIAPYVVQAKYSINSSVYYSFAPNALGEKIRIENSITNGYATFLWDNKPSGAEITVKYSYTPFAADTSASVQVMAGNNGEQWVTTKYKLGKTISGQDLNKSASTYNVTEDCILDDQGIYYLTFTDDAGNVCNYAFIIDRTENWFVVDGTTTVHNGNYLSASQVSYVLGNRKVFDLDTSIFSDDNLEEKAVKTFIENAARGTVSSIENYYDGNYANASQVAKYFEYLGGEYYFTVKNLGVIAYDNTGVKDEAITGTSGVIVAQNTNKNEFKRKLVAKSENSLYSQTENITSVVESYATIVINTDNALGSVFFSSVPGDSSVPELDSNETYTKIDLGSRADGADATSAKHVSFVWKKGSGVFEVEKVELDFYSLKFDGASVVDGKNPLLYHYEFAETTIIYGGANDDVVAVGSERLLYQFNGELSSAEGLYVVRRTYKGYDAHADQGIYGKDLGVREYYFIVDRNGVIDLNNGIGANIKLWLQENVVEFNDFAQINTETGIISYVENNREITKKYNIYLKTNRLPAVVSVPIEKYFNEQKYSSSNFDFNQAYYAGRLNVRLFYADTEGQFVNTANTGKIVEIFNSKVLHENGILKENIDNNGYFNIDIKKYLNYVGYNRDFVNALSGVSNGNWIYLPGDYVVVITDNTRDEIGASHEKVFAFKIDSNMDIGPQTDIKYGYNENSLWTLEKNGGTSVQVTTSQKYLQIVMSLPNDADARNAQLDQNYLNIEQVNNGASGMYLGLNGYVSLGDLANNRPDFVVKNDDGSFTVKLDTKLDENDLQASLNRNLKYIIKLRYILGNSSREQYLECYHYYDGNGNKVYYYETTYTIIIDRIAPSDNINMLNSTDTLVKEYCENQGVEAMFESGLYDSNEQLYFTRQYAKYYDAKKKYEADAGKYIYIYQVGETTRFSTNDIAKVYVRALDKDNMKYLSLSLPMYSTRGYSLNDLTQRTISRFADLHHEGNAALIAGNYYEIIEQDAAGNTTQYVIAYGVGASTYEIPVAITPINADETEVVITDKTSSLDVFNIEKKSSSSLFKNDYFFKINLSKNNVVIRSWLTNILTNFSALGDEIVDAINDAAQDGKNATYQLNVVARKMFNTTTISLYQDTNVVLYASDLVVNNSRIIFNRANKDSVYATEIRVYKNGVLSSYTSAWDEGSLKYIDNNGNTQTGLDCQLGATYSVTVVSVLGTTSTYRFVAGQGGNIWHNVEFDGGHGYLMGDQYYGFADAVLTYNSSIYNKVVLNGVEQVVIGDISLPAVKNSVVEYVILLTAKDTGEITTLKVVIDKRLGSVVLNNTSIGILGDGYLGQEDNVEIEKEITLQKIATGAITLSWSEVENNYFDYVYILYGLDANKVVKRKVILLSQLYFGIVPNEDYSIYRFEIRVYQKGKADIEALSSGAISLDQIAEWQVGNRVYAFEVKLSSNIFYEVRFTEPIGNESPILSANAKFNLGEIIEATIKPGASQSDYETAIKTMFNVLNEEDYNSLKDVNYDLYLSNRSLYLVTIDAESKVKIALSLSANKKYFELISPTGNAGNTYLESDLTNANLVVYEIIKSGISNLYVGILKIGNTSSLVSNVKLINGTTSAQDVQDITSFTVYGDASIKANVRTETNALLKKNTLKMDIYFIDRFVKYVDVYADNSGEFNYIIRGNGEYSFKILDLAGNVHLFDGERFDTLVVNVVREVNVTINGEAPVSHAIYNKEVELIVYKSQIYNAGSVSVEAYRNGSAYTPQGNNPRYWFKDYGNYRVIVRAEYSVGNELKKISKTVYFSILNINEARMSIDLTSMAGNTLIKVTNPEGKDVTNAFRSMMNSSNFGGANVSYDAVMSNAAALGVASGKLRFVLQYQVVDANYPTRIVEFGFTLNNETPKIHCTLSSGESTKKSFEIYFNPQIIFEQVGDSGVYINGELVAVIDENATNEEIRITRSFKAHGDGDYYVTLVSGSGLILDSYKVVIKEPLNVGAIIVIIVVSAVVLTVTTAIIVLRRKMRIR